MEPTEKQEFMNKINGMTTEQLKMELERVKNFKNERERATGYEETPFDVSYLDEQIQILEGKIKGWSSWLPIPWKGGSRTNKKNKGSRSKKHKKPKRNIKNKTKRNKKSRK
jgi:hypothetical protein